MPPSVSQAQVGADLVLQARELRVHEEPAPPQDVTSRDWLQLWARVVAGFLRPGALFYIRDSHPVLDASTGTVTPASSC